MLDKLRDMLEKIAKEKAREEVDVESDLVALDSFWFLDYYGDLIVAALEAADTSYAAGPGAPTVIDEYTLEERQRLLKAANSAARTYHTIKETK